MSKVALEAASNSKDIKTGKSKIKLTETIKYAGKEMEYVEAVGQMINTNVDTLLSASFLPFYDIFTE